MKKTTWLENPDKAALKESVIPSSGSRATKIRQVMIMGRASKIRRIRKAATRPMARTPAAPSCSVPGIRQLIRMTAAASRRPVKFRLFIA